MCPNAVIPMSIFSIVHRRLIAQAKRYELSKIIKICFSKSEIKVNKALFCGNIAILKVKNRAIAYISHELNAIYWVF